MSALRRALIASMLATGSVAAAESREGVPRSQAATSDHDALQQVAGMVGGLLVDHGIAATLSWRVKSPSSLAAKVRRKGLAHDDVLDRLGVRVIVDTTQDCYTVRDLLEARYLPIPGSDRDYVQQPKANGYQSLHVAAHTPIGAVEFQVRTHAMHATAEHGSAAHAQYKLETAA